MSTQGTTPPSLAAVFPDVCKSPAPVAASPVPIPYPNAPLKTDWNTTNAIRRVELQRKHGVTAERASRLTGTTGDEAGAGKGIVSPLIAGTATTMNHSSLVKVDGKTTALATSPMQRF